MVRTVPDGDAVLIPVRAQPGASRDRISGEYDGALKIAVSAAPERGRANAAIAAVLAKTLGVRRAAVTLVSGATSRNKVFRVEGRTAEDVQAVV